MCSYSGGVSPKLAYQSEKIMSVELKFMTEREIIDDLMATLNEEAKDYIRKQNKTELIQYHSNWGQHIRNEYSMWMIENPYVVHGDSFHHDFPDQRSMRIIEGVWELLQITK